MSHADLEVVTVDMIHRTKKGTLLKSPAELVYKAGRIYFKKSPFALKDEIKAMKGSRWHGFDEEPPLVIDGKPIFKIWSIEDCQRNQFQLAFLTGEDVYAWFDRDLIEHDYRDYELNGKPADPMPHQFDLANAGLTYHYQIWAAEMGVGKSLSAQMVIEHSSVKHWYWVGPRTSLPNVKREFKKWGFNFDGDITIEFMTYEELVRRMDDYKPGDKVPGGMICDESSRLKGATSQRSNAAQKMADLIRQEYGYDGYVIEMSGTPSPKSPADWWSQTEIAWPGFLREGSAKQLQKRLGFMKRHEYESGVFDKLTSWRDDERKCETCGEYAQHENHVFTVDGENEDYHEWKASINEIALMYERLEGLVVIKHKKDCLTLPDKRYRRVICKPSNSMLRVASSLMQAAPNTITGLTWLRELSDGFQYKDKKDGKTPCQHCGAKGTVEEWYDTKDESRSYSAIDMLDAKLVARLQKRDATCPRCDGTKEVDKIVRETREVPCPKEAALKIELDRCEETGRIVIFAGFTGSVDRVTRICLKEGWAVVRCDGRGWEVQTMENGELQVVTSAGEDALEYWSDLAANPRVAFVAHPESGGMSLTLVESEMIVFWSNSFKPEYRAQAEDRCHRKGMNEHRGLEIVDLTHLPSDERVLDVIRSNRAIELMSLGEFAWSEDGCVVAVNTVPNETIEYLAAA